MKMAQATARIWMGSLLLLLRTLDTNMVVDVQSSKKKKKKRPHPYFAWFSCHAFVLVFLHGLARSYWRAGLGFRVHGRDLFFFFVLSTFFFFLFIITLEPRVELYKSL